MSEILGITAPIFLIVAAGYAAVRLGLLVRSELRTLGAFVIHIALPALILRTLTQPGFVTAFDGAYLLGYAGGSLVLFAAGLLYAARVQGWNLGAAALYGAGMSCSNSGFIGYPIVAQWLGPRAALALALTLIVENLLMLPLLMTLAEAGSGHGTLCQGLLRAAAGLRRNPIVIAIVLACVCALFELRPPTALARAIDLLAQASAPVALFTIGGTLVGLRVEGLRGDIMRIAGAKLLLHPLAVAGALLLLPPADPVLTAAAIGYAAMPMLSIYPIFGQKYGDATLCAAALMVATLLAALTVSAWIALLGRPGWPGH